MLAYDLLPSVMDTRALYWSQSMLYMKVMLYYMLAQNVHLSFSTTLSV